MAELPGYLRWLEWVAGSDWPAGDPDGMWALAGDWRTAASELREILADIDAAKSATLKAYPEGEGIEEMSRLFDNVRSGDGSEEDGSLTKLADLFDSVAESAHGVGTEIEYAQLMVITSLALLAVEIAAAWIFPPTAPAVEAAAIGFTRVGIRLLAQQVMNRVIGWMSRLVGQRAASFLVRHMAIDTFIGTFQELGVQGWQVSQGHRGNINWERTAVTAISSAAGGGAAGPVADALGRRLGNAMPDSMNPGAAAALVGAGTGAGAGAAGAMAGFGASVGTQFVFDGVQHGWGTAWDNVKKTEFDPRMLTAGVSNGAATGASRALSDQVARARHPQWYSSTGGSGQEPGFGAGGLSSPVAAGAGHTSGDGNASGAADPGSVRADSSGNRATIPDGPGDLGSGSDATGGVAAKSGGVEGNPGSGQPGDSSRAGPADPTAANQPSDENAGKNLGEADRGGDTGDSTKQAVQPEQNTSEDTSTPPGDTGEVDGTSTGSAEPGAEPIGEPGGDASSTPEFAADLDAEGDVSAESRGEAQQSRDADTDTVVAGQDDVPQEVAGSDERDMAGNASPNVGASAPQNDSGSGRTGADRTGGSSRRDQPAAEDNQDDGNHGDRTSPANESSSATEQATAAGTAGQYSPSATHNDADTDGTEHRSTPERSDEPVDSDASRAGISDVASDSMPSEGGVNARSEGAEVPPADGTSRYAVDTDDSDESVGSGKPAESGERAESESAESPVAEHPSQDSKQQLGEASPAEQDEGSQRREELDDGQQDEQQSALDETSGSSRAVDEYNALVRDRAAHASEQEFWRAKRDDRAARLGVDDPDAVLNPDRLTTTIEELSGAIVGERDLAGTGEEAPARSVELVGPAERERRLRRIFSLQDAAERFNAAESALAQLDRRIAGLEDAAVHSDRPPPAEVSREQNRLARERANAVLALKRWRVMRADIAARLKVDPSRLAQETLADTLAEVAARTVPAEQAELHRRNLELLTEAAERFNRAENEVGRIQDGLAELSGADRELFDAAGARRITDRVGLLEGAEPHIVVVAPRGRMDSPRADFDAALSDALERSAAVGQALQRPETEISYRQIVAERDSTWQVSDLQPPRVELVTSPWRSESQPGIHLTRWRDGAGNWHEVRPERAEWQTNRDGPSLPKTFHSRDLPEGVSGWAVNPFQAAAVDVFVDPEGGGQVNAGLLPIIPGAQPPSIPDVTYTLPFADAFYHTIRIIIETAKLSGFTWFSNPDTPGLVSPGFTGHPWFRKQPADVQPMVREWDATERADDSHLGELYQQRQREAERQWLRVQEWADDQYERFRADDSDVDRMAENVNAFRESEWQALAQRTVDEVVEPPHGSLEKTVERLQDTAIGRNDGDAARLVEDLKAVLYHVPGVDRSEIVGLVYDQLRQPSFTAEDIQRVKNHLMHDEQLIRDPHDGTLVRSRLNAVADAAEAWNRLITGTALPQDVVLLQDALVESEYLSRNPTATWRDANQHAIMRGYDWNANRPPLTDWRADIPYAPARLDSRGLTLPPDPGRTGASTGNGPPNNGPDTREPKWRNHLPGSSMRSHIPHPPRDYETEWERPPHIEPYDPGTWPLPESPGLPNPPGQEPPSPSPEPSPVLL